jgi:exodeoxyribonuclease V alpha subunit
VGGGKRMGEASQQLTGSVERITYYNPENGYSVVRLRPERGGTPARGAQLYLQAVDREGLVTIVGAMPELTPGETLQLTGRWMTHPKHGFQFQVETCQQVLPATTTGIRRYLGSGLIRGIGSRLADRIVAQFGAQTLEVIEQNPERLRQVPDIGLKRMQMIARAWDEQKQIKEIMLFLHGYGVSTNLAVKIYKTYAQQAMAVVQSDPYRLARDIRGVGFKTADKIAQALGLPLDHPSRLEAGVVHLLNQLSDEGHVYVPRQELTEQSGELLAQPIEGILAAVGRLETSGQVKVEQVPLKKADHANLPAKISETNPDAYRLPAVYLTPMYHAELGAAGRMQKLLKGGESDHGFSPTRLADLPAAFVQINKISSNETALSTEQEAAVRTALRSPVSILTGGPGTGKTTALRALITILRQAGKRFALASPTGRAAKRLSEATGHPASTIHRLLGFSPTEGFRHNADTPLPIDMLVVDEASMLDLVLFNSLLKAIEPGTHLLLVGDVDQLPSVGAGDVLRDLMDSDQVPVSRLTTIFRQAAGSEIITNAHRINHGEMPHFCKADDPGGDFFLFPTEEPEQAADWVQQIVSQRIPEKFGLHPLTDIQVLAPMYRGPAGVHALNQALQAVLNPADSRKLDKNLYGTLFRVGDKVMQTQNNYDKEVFNGDIGYIAGIDLVEHNLEVAFESGKGALRQRVLYDWSEADQIVPAYAISVHKSQGSEFKAVVIPILTSHYLMLQRNLLYTAVTRAARLCVLVGSRRAISMAVNNNRVAQRYTALDSRLRER